MMVNIVGAQGDARKTVEKVIFLVGGVVRADDSNRGRTMIFVDLRQPARDFLQRIFPTGGLQFAVAANEGLANSLRVAGEIKSKAAFGAEKFAVESGMVAIVGAQDFIVADAERGLAAVGAMGARGAVVSHFPGSRLIAVGAAGERAYGADIDAHAAFFASQFAGLVGEDHGLNAARS